MNLKAKRLLHRASFIPPFIWKNQRNFYPLNKTYLLFIEFCYLDPDITKISELEAGGICAG